MLVSNVVHTFYFCVCSNLHQPFLNQTGNDREHLKVFLNTKRIDIMLFFNLML